jgi:molybdopterin converting factor small subunit
LPKPASEKFVEIRVRFFSHLRDLASAGETNLEIEKGATVEELLQRLYALRPAIKAADKTILVAAGVEFVGRDYVIREGEEISVMPPVQGG